MGSYESERYSDVAVVMITRNEEAAVAKVIRDAQEALPGAEIFVIDGSTDATPEIARKLGATVVPEPGGGFGPALHAALTTPHHDIVVTVDADDTYPASAFPVLVRLIREGWDVAGTDRLGTHRPKSMNLFNWFANHAFSGLASLRARTRLRDVHSGQRAYRSDVIHSFDWDYAGLAFPVDLLFWPALVGRKVTEIPITYSERIGETKLRRWRSGKATMRRLLRPRSSVRRMGSPGERPDRSAIRLHESSSGQRSRE
jgi:glycosyltransferase involved in cell wall biosynthesis